MRFGLTEFFAALPSKLNKIWLKSDAEHLEYELEIFGNEMTLNAMQKVDLPDSWFLKSLLEAL